MKSSSTVARVLGAGFGFALLSAVQIASAEPVLIVKPLPHNSQGQLAGGAADLSGDFSLMGSQMLGSRFTDSGGAYLFENGNTEPRQVFQLNGAQNLTYRVYGINQGNVFHGATTQCSFTTEQVKGAYLGDRVAISSQWVALSSYNMGHNANPPNQLANCANQAGTVPYVFLAKRNASGAARPFGNLTHAINVPFRDRVSAMDITDTDLVMVSDGYGAHVFSYNAVSNQWLFNRTVLLAENLDVEFGQQVVAIDGDTFVLGDKNDRRIFVYRKQGNTWSHLLTHTSAGNSEFGRAVDITDDRIAVGSEDGVHFFELDGNTLSPINSILGAPVRLVAINGDYATGVEDMQVDFIWQYHLSPAEGGYYKSGGVGGVGIQWNASNLTMDGIRVLAGYPGYGQGGNNLIGSMIWDSQRYLFADAAVVDHAEGERIWRNGGKFNWQRHSGPTPSGSAGTGPSGGVGGGHYYFVETSQGDGAYYSGQTALLESEHLQANSTVHFDFHMYGDHIGKLYLEYLDDGQWRTAVLLDGQVAANRSTNWQHLSVNLGGLWSGGRARFRYVAHGGYKGDVALDNIVVTRT